MPLQVLRSSSSRPSALSGILRHAGNVRSSPRRWQSTRQEFKPLRVLFCGSDEFSSESLRALHEEHRRDPSSVASIDVLIRPGKLSGRGMKTIREVPLKSVAQELGLALHERNTFTGWNLPRPNGHNINLIIAVSFGLFVPPRILNSAEYGGVNVHPSLLPDFRGPAPLHHVLLAGETHTGVTLQTLHPERFDHGAILVQTPRPGFEIPSGSQCTYSELLEFITPRAANVLIQGIRDRVFVPPIQDISYTLPYQDPDTFRPAPKITPADRQVNWETMTASEICRRDRVMGRLWSMYQPECEEAQRIIFHDLKEVPLPQACIDWQQGKVKDNEMDVRGLPVVGIDGKSVKGPPFVKNGGCIVVLTEGGGAILIREITKEGEKRLPAAEALLGKGGSDAMSDVVVGSVIFGLRTLF